jgi:hypothetical protein
MKKNLNKRAKVRKDRKGATKERIYMHLSYAPKGKHEKILSEVNSFRARYGFPPITE